MSETPKLYSKEKFLYKEINSFYTKIDKKDVGRIIDIINGESQLSLRLFDWYVTQYVKHHVVNCNNTEGEPTTVYISYKSMLDVYKKIFFDPFCRSKNGFSNKFTYNYDKKDKTKVIKTSICQLNFFMWALQTKLVDIINKDYENLSKEMCNYYKQIKQKKKDKTDSSDDSDHKYTQPAMPIPAELEIEFD